MFLANPSTIFFLAILMIASLILARVAQERQESNMVRLYRLAALDQRRVATKGVIRALQQLDEHPELFRILYQSLKADLQRIQTLDPGRADLDNEIRQTQSAISAQVDEPRGERAEPAQTEMSEQRRQRLDRRTSLSSEREMNIMRHYIVEAANIVKRMYQFRHVRADQLESVARYLGTLSALVGVNSYLHMGELSLESGDKIKALSSYRKAELMLQRSPLKGRERADRQILIDGYKGQLLARSKSEQGLLLLASGE